MRQVRLTVVEGELAGDSCVLLPPGGTVGRSPDCTWPLNTSNVSRRHASLHMTEQGWCIEDLGSTNGTRINETLLRSQSMLLPPSGELAFGSTVVRFVVERMTARDGGAGPAPQLTPDTVVNRTGQPPRAPTGLVSSAHQPTQLPPTRLTEAGSQNSDSLWGSFSSFQATRLEIQVPPPAPSPPPEPGARPSASPVTLPGTRRRTTGSHRQTKGTQATGKESPDSGELPVALGAQTPRPQRPPHERVDGGRSGASSSAVPVGPAQSRKDSEETLAAAFARIEQLEEQLKRAQTNSARQDEAATQARARLLSFEAALQQAQIREQQFKSHVERLQQRSAELEASLATLRDHAAGLERQLSQPPSTHLFDRAEVELTLEKGTSASASQPKPPRSAGNLNMARALLDLFAEALEGIERGMEQGTPHSKLLVMLEQASFRLADLRGALES